jgi:hypothetical protein
MLHRSKNNALVMAGLDPAIHAAPAPANQTPRSFDGRVEPGRARP